MTKNTKIRTALVKDLRYAKRRIDYLLDTWAPFRIKEIFDPSLDDGRRYSNGRPALGGRRKRETQEYPENQVTTVLKAADELRALAHYLKATAAAMEAIVASGGIKSEQ